jgi:hypothetical protein
VTKTSLSEESKKFDFVKLSYKLAFWVPIPFWIFIYTLNLLPVLFPSYKGRDIANPLFFIPGVIFIVAVAIDGICKIAIYKIEKDLYLDPEKKHLFIKIPMTKSLYEYMDKKSYGKLFLIVILWASEFIAIATYTTMVFGFFIRLKY